MGIWSRARAGATDQRSAQQSHFWDTAARGSSALRAALVRAVIDETAGELGFQFAMMLLDLEKFYDN
eukprot:7021173-Pyramimonas_sp.AAC.1